MIDWKTRKRVKGNEKRKAKRGVKEEECEREHKHKSFISTFSFLPLLVSLTASCLKLENKLVGAWTVSVCAAQ